MCGNKTGPRAARDGEEIWINRWSHLFVDGRRVDKLTPKSRPTRGSPGLVEHMLNSPDDGSTCRDQRFGEHGFFPTFGKCEYVNLLDAIGAYGFAGMVLSSSS